MPLTTTDILPQKITSNKNTQLNLDRFRQGEFKDESTQCTLISTGLQTSSTKYISIKRSR
nr:palindromic element RPE3 domain-containing protein [Rickettsia rhipicephali]